MRLCMRALTRISHHTVMPDTTAAKETMMRASTTMNTAHSTY